MYLLLSWCIWNTCHVDSVSLLESFDPFWFWTSLSWMANSSSVLDILSNPSGAFLVLFVLIRGIIITILEWGASLRRKLCRAEITESWLRSILYTSHLCFRMLSFIPYCIFHLIDYLFVDGHDEMWLPKKKKLFDYLKKKKVWLLLGLREKK